LKKEAGNDKVNKCIVTLKIGTIAIKYRKDNATAGNKQFMERRENEI